MKPLLLVDAGNTRIKWATATAGGKLERVHSMQTSQATARSLAALHDSFAGHQLILSSVVPRVTPLFTRLWKRACHRVAADSPALGFEFDYPRPAELGADRLAAAAAIHAEGRFPAIIVACGTATAYSVLDAKGRFCGGAIAPGLESQLAALLGRAAQLPEVDLKEPESPLAKSTREAIRSGVVLNFQGGVKETVARLSEGLGKRPRLVLTGGNARLAAERLGLPHQLRPLLVLEGLLIIGNRLATAGE